MIIAVDFDGTIVEHKYPHIGKEIPFAIATLKKLQTEHHILILWTVREGKFLKEAIEFCRKKGLEFYAVNRNYPEETDEIISFKTDVINAISHNKIYTQKIALLNEDNKELLSETIQRLIDYFHFSI